MHPINSIVGDIKRQANASGIVPHTGEPDESMDEMAWMNPLLVLLIVNVSALLCFEMFVIYKAYRTIPNRRHLFLGQTLLIGLMLATLVGFCFVPKIKLLTCYATRFGIGISYSIIFGTLLVKSVFLLSLHGGTYLPASYQALLLFFIVGIQLVIELQWFFYKKPELIRWSGAPSQQRLSPVLPLSARFGKGPGHYGDASLSQTSDRYSETCNHELSSVLLSLVYNMFLIVLIACFSVKTRGYRENHHESSYISLSVLGTVIIWIIWMGGAFFPSMFAPHIQPVLAQDAFLAYGLVSNAVFIFVVMFLPKTRQLAAMGKECFYDDRDALSRPPSSPSVYAPSFLHLKPTFYPFISKPTNNWRLYKQLNGGSPVPHQVTPVPQQPLSQPDHFLRANGPYISTPRVWRNGFINTGYVNGISQTDELCYYPYDLSMHRIHSNTYSKANRLPFY